MKAARSLQPNSVVASSRRRLSPLSILKPADDRALPPSPDDLAGLVQAVAQQQDRTAFAVLFKHFAPRVKTYLMRAGAEPELAEELVQETMVTLWRKAALFDARQAAVSTWVFTIARNLRVGRFRRQGAANVQMESDEAELAAMPCPIDPPDERLHAMRCQERLRAALRSLPPEQAQVLQLSYFEEHPHARIAQELGVPLGTVKSRVRLAVAHLRKLLEGLA